MEAHNTHSISLTFEITDSRYAGYRPVSPVEFRPLNKGEVGYDLRNACVFDNRYFREFSRGSYVVLEKVSDELQGDPNGNGDRSEKPQAIDPLYYPLDNTCVNDWEEVAKSHLLQSCASKINELIEAVNHLQTNEGGSE